MLYLLLAVGLGAVPAGSSKTGSDVKIFVRSNGVHTDLALPYGDWRKWFPSDHFPQSTEGAEFVALGWGDRGVYLNVPNWSDLTPGLFLSAAIGTGETAVHVSLTGALQEAPDCRPLELSRAQYDRLCSTLRGAFDLDSKGLPRPISGAHYHDWDAFYEGKGTYTLFNNCNVWTGSALKSADAPTGLWTPLAQSVLQHLPLTKH